MPGHPQLLTGLGTIALQKGDFSKAEQFLQQSIAAYPEQAIAQCNRGVALVNLDRLSDAQLCYQLAIQLKPDYATAHNNLGLLLKDLQRLDEALLSFDAAIAVQPNYAEAYYNQGLVWEAKHNFQSALVCYQRAVELKPDFDEAYKRRENMLHILEAEAVKENSAGPYLESNVDVFVQQGIGLHGQGDFRSAITRYDQVLALKPDYVEIYLNRGLAYQELREYQQAAANYRQAIDLQPAFAEAHNNYGIVLHKLQQYSAAVNSFATALDLKPEYAAAYNNRALSLIELGKYTLALNDFQQAARLEPENNEALRNQGNALLGLNQPLQAVELFNKALALAPHDAVAYNNRGNALKELNRLDEADCSYDQALSLDPAYANAYWNKALLKILRGQYAEGWQLYEWRWRSARNLQVLGFSQPQWHGEQNIAGKTLLIVPEQGLGDFIQFCRYVPRLDVLGANIIIQVPVVLKDLLASLKGHFSLVEEGESLPDYDLYCPIMSFPYAFKTTLEDVPANVPYLYADAKNQSVWSRRLGAKTKTRVGLVWSGSIEHKNDHNRSLSFSLLEPLLQLPYEFHVLQKDIRFADQEAMTAYPQLHIHQKDLSNFAATAALVSAMDLVISVDTSVAHLVGALGKPLWLLLPYAPDYRWLLDRVDSPWYPTAILFRQPAMGDWQSVIALLQERLQAI